MLLHPARFRPLLLALKRIGLLSVAVLVSCQHCPTAEAQQTQNNIVAVVNADPITRKSLGEATLKRFGKDVIDNMVNRHLILQACQAKGINVTSKEVSEEVARLAGKFGLSVDAYLKLLQDERQISPNQYSREIIWPMLALRRLVADQVEPTKKEFDQAFISQFGEAIKCRLIMIDDRAKAEQLQQQAAANPTTFAALAKKFSQDESSASVGGLIPPIRRYSGDSRLEDAAFALKDGDVSPVLQLGDQWVVLQAVRKIPASMPQPQALPAITEQIKDRIRDQKMRGASGKLFTQLQKDAKVVKILGNPKLETQYPGTAAIVNGQQVSIASVAAEGIKRHGPDVLLGEINRALLAQALAKSGKQVTDEDIRAEVVKAAKSYGYVRSNGEADIEAWMEFVVRDSKNSSELYIQDSVWPSVALQKLVTEKVQITNDDIQQGFESAFGPRAEVLAIVLSDQRAAQKVWEMARDNDSEEFFGQLAEQYSVEPVSASNRGKVPPIRKFGGQPAIEREAFSLKPGALSGIIATGDKYIVLRCQGHTKPIVTDISAVKEELLRDIREKKLAIAMSKEFDRLKDTAEIDNFLEVEKVAAAPAAATKQR